MQISKCKAFLEPMFENDINGYENVRVFIIFFVISLTVERFRDGIPQGMEKVLVWNEKNIK